MSPRFVSVAVSLAALFSSTVSLRAQVPDGWMVGSAFKQIGYTTGGGGLTVFHPHRNERWQVAGLPADLTGIGVTTTQVHGANCVLLRPSDGHLFVGEVSIVPGDTLEIHEIVLRGRRVVSNKRHRIGVRDPNVRGAAIEQMAFLPDGRILFAWVGVMAPGLTSNLAILDPATSAVVPVPLSGVGAGVFFDALALDATGTTAYFAVNERSAPTSTRLYSVPVPGGGAVQLLSQRSGNVAAKLWLDHSRDLLVALAGSDTGLHRFDGATWTRISPVGVRVRGAFALDSITGDYICRVDISGIQRLERIDRAGTRTLLQTLPAGSEVIVGMAEMPSVQSYGTASPGAYRFAVSPSPGGAPVLGNAGFSLTGEATNGAMPGWLALGATAIDRPVLGFQLLVDQFGLLVPLPPAGTVTVPLAIPTSSSLVGVRVYAQMAHANGTSLLGSKGLSITLF